eukprot:gene10517-1914_t
MAAPPSVFETSEHPAVYSAGTSGGHSTETFIRGYRRIASPKLPCHAPEPNPFMIQVDPGEVRFTHSKIRPFFSCGRRVLQTLDDISKGLILPADLPSISVLQNDSGDLVSLNNRRLYVLKEDVLALNLLFDAALSQSLDLLQGLSQAACAERGLLPGGTVAVRLKPKAKLQGKRQEDRYTTERCSLKADLMVEHGAPHTKPASSAPEKQTRRSESSTLPAKPRKGKKLKAQLHCNAAEEADPTSHGHSKLAGELAAFGVGPGDSDDSSY